MGNDPLAGDALKILKHPVQIVSNVAGRPGTPIGVVAAQSAKQRIPRGDTSLGMQLPPFALNTDSTARRDGLGLNDHSKDNWTR